MSPEPSKIGETPKPPDPSEVEAAVEQDPPEDRPPSYEVDEKISSGSQMLRKKTGGLVPRWVENPLARKTGQLVLQVNAKNIPGLMRHGFYCSLANFVPGRGSILLDRRELLKERGLGRTHCKHIRAYKEKGNENTEIEWRGILEVYAKSSSTLINFDLNWLTHDNMLFAKAWDWNSKQVYSYSQYRERRNVNVVYEGIPLKGWWPWPKASPPSQADPSMVGG
ncbi:unnamed protein product [Clonostachys rhizophaga]|uniref:Uncharacterized protein n=1 Tax=Clonostachys rhizophaga TaxID=160324 RepID=A0A9N9W4J4_9HYPO|nr:unnamed protein product [Clonostachys rhizophaga]